MGTITMIGQLLLALSILIILHEWGHYQTARWFGIKVEKFFLFFDAWGKKLFSYKKGDTEYGVGWLPLGGYVKIAGMIDESMDKSFADKPAEDYEFRSKPVWQRLIVMLGGVTVNILLGVLIYTGIKFYYGEQYQTMEMVPHGIVAYDLAEDVGLQTGDKIIKVNGESPERFSDILDPDLFISDGIFTVQRADSTFTLQLPADFTTRFKDQKGQFIDPRIVNKIDEVVPGSPADKAGLQAGDKILQVNNKEVRFFDQIKPALAEVKGEEIALTIMRNGVEKSISLEVSDDGTIGYRPAFPYKMESFGLGQSFVKGAEDAFNLLLLNIKGFKKIFSGEINASDSVAGPIGIARMFGSEWDWFKFWRLTGALSMILAFMNILPIPALDGGHVFFLLIEWVRGKPLSDKALERAQLVGFVILLTLMVLIFGNDIYQAVFK